MNYYLDTEFHEYHKQHKVCGLKVGNPTPTIDLISIGIVSEDIKDNIDFNKELDKTSINFIKLKPHKEYYAISKNFNVKDAWNSWQYDLPYNPAGVKVYWLRETVLKPIFRELLENERKEYNGGTFDDYFDLKNFTKLINKYGKSKKQIAEEIKAFIIKDTHIEVSTGKRRMNTTHDYINFYSYYADYDWVVFCQLFGKMNDLPKGFPMYCIDLKQMLDQEDEVTRLNYSYIECIEELSSTLPPKSITEHKNYPKQDNKHNALDNARWNKELHKFIKTF